jgi:diadenosine tetraphosphate (Ap4A) HIT family hydrolase
VESILELTYDELKALYEVIVNTRHYIKIVRNPDGFNIGINEGRAAGQTVPHLHIHVIPRYNGDMEDPRGGVRGVIPEKQKY